MDSKMVGTTRMYLALIIVPVVISIAAIAISVPAALAVFDKLNPILMLILGYYFGQSK